MNYYVVQVLTGKEELFLKLSGQQINMKLFWLRKELITKKLGIKKKTTTSIFPGYIFAEAEKITDNDYLTLKKIPGFCRFLKNNQDIRPLPDDDKRIILKLQSSGDILIPSTVMFDRDDRIHVIKGPLKGMEGQIIKVDKRKKRAKIKLKLYENSFTIDFGFEVIDKINEKSDLK